jgi:hypothetical protein
MHARLNARPEPGDIAHGNPVELAGYFRIDHWHDGNVAPRVVRSP